MEDKRKPIMIYDLHKFVEEQCCKALSRPFGGIIETTIRIKLEPEWAQQIKDRIKKYNMVFAHYIKSPLVDFLTDQQPNDVEAVKPIDSFESGRMKCDVTIIKKDLSPIAQQTVTQLQEKIAELEKRHKSYKRRVLDRKLVTEAKLKEAKKALEDIIQNKRQWESTGEQNTRMYLLRSAGISMHALDTIRKEQGDADKD